MERGRKTPSTRFCHLTEQQCGKSLFAPMASLMDICPGQLCQTVRFIRQDWSREKKDQNPKKGNNLEAVCVFSVPQSFSTCTQWIWTVRPYIAAVKLLSSLCSCLSTTSGFQLPKVIRLTCMHSLSLPLSFSGCSCPFWQISNPPASFSCCWCRIRNPRAV